MPRKPIQQTSIAGFGCIFQRSYVDRHGNTKRTNTWTIEYGYNWPGGPIRRSARTTDQAAAYAELAKLHGQFHSGELAGASSPEKARFADLFALLYADYQGKRHHSFGDMKARVEKWLQPAFGEMRVVDLRKRDVEAFVERASVKLETATVNKLLAYMRRAMQLGADEDPPLVHRIPKAWLKKSAEDNARTGTLSAEQYDCLKRAMPAHAALALCIGYHTGMRRGLILELRWEWVDLAAAVMRIPPETNATKKRPRLVPIYGDMRSMLEMARGTATSPYVIEFDGKRIYSLKRAWKTACRVCGCPTALFHDLRRTAATNALLAGVPESDILEMCGWRTSAMLRRYAQSIERRAVATGERMQAYLDAIKVEDSSRTGRAN